RIDQIPGADRLQGFDQLAAAGRDLNRSRHIDRVAVWRLKSTALESLYADFGGDADFDRFTKNGGAALRGYATFCALAEIHGVPWGKWAPRWQRPDHPDVTAFADSGAGAERVRYHAWLQWLLDRQLHDASLATGLIHDLAIGTDAGGADAWLWQDSLALEARVGAPPDEFNTQGQNWGLPPVDPWRLQAAEYEPFIQVVRAGLRHGAGLRFDHVMGLFRLFWIPEGASPVDGTYVRYPWGDLLDILALESHRSGAFIVGEDLGTVEDFVRRELYERGVLSYRLLWFEPSEPKHWPTQALGAVTTHDLPTIAGLWSGSDLEAQRRIGLHPNEAATVLLRIHLAEMTGVDEDAAPDRVVRAAYRLLGEASCAVLTATLDDALAVEERPNMPGTIDEWPNWSLALPEPLEVLEVSPLAADIAHSLQRVPDWHGSPVDGPPGADGPLDPLVE
ncbi:MAG TPA: 4-alpha-glucanotransferase, partial [Acidimicrobiales bacterium]